MASFSVGETIREPRRKSCLQNFPLGLRQIVPESAQANGALLFVKDHIGGSPVSVSWLSNAARVDEVPLTRFQEQLIKGQSDN
jgi:hypothetical protein